ncbi:MAG: TonB-dependent receptor [Pseudomonadota bacterium]
MNRIPLLLTFTLSLVCAQEIVQMEKIEVQENVSVIEERKESSIAKRIITGSELTQYGDMNALEVLKRTPGVTLSDGKGKKGAPGKGYTVVMIDGEQTSGSKRGNPLEQISPDMIERIEVMTNGSAEYTAESMGGIVNIVLKKPKSQGLSRVKITAGAYSDQPMGSLFAQQEGKSGHLSYLINTTISDNSQADEVLTHTNTPTSSSDETSDYDARYRSLSLNTKLIYSTSPKNKYTFDGAVNVNDYDKTTLDTRTIDGALTPDRIIHGNDSGDGAMVWAKLSGNHNISTTELVEWKLKYHQNNQTSNTRTQSTTLLEQNDDNNYRVFGTEGSYSVALENHFIKTGFELKHSSQHDEVTSSTNGMDTTSMSENKGSVYLQDEVTFGENMVMTPGLRYETLHRDYDTTTSIGYVAPSLHLLYKLTPNDNVRASIAKTVKLPRLNELSSNVDSSLYQNDLTHPDVIGNPDLKEEEALSYELRGEHFFEDKGVVSIGGFYRSLTDKIEKMTTYNPTALRYEERPYNSGNGGLWGIELELKKSLNRYVEGLGMFANATFQNSSLTNSANNTTYSIKGTNDYIYNVGLDHTIPSYRLTYGGAYRYVSGYDDSRDINGFAESQKGYGTLDFYAIKRLNDTFKLSLNLKNITHTTIETVSNDYNAGTTQIDKERSTPIILLSLEGKW